MAASLGRPLAAALALALFSTLAWRARADPAVSYLPGGAAPWIVADEPFRPKAGFVAPSYVHFRRRFTVGPASEGELRLRARRASQVVLDGKVVLPPGEAAGGWKNERRVILRPGPGEHELLVVVRAEPGPAALSAEVAAWGLRTGPDWQAAAGDRGWPQARLAATPRRAVDFDDRPRAAEGFAATLPWLIPFMLLGAWLSRRGLRRPWLWAAGGWSALAVLNLARLPSAVGFDSLAHVELARLISAAGLPGPGESWQSFQAPLYHLLCAPLAAFKLTDDALLRFMRAPNLLCGFLLAWLCARFAALARPGRSDAPAAAALFALALAPNLYMSQAPGNEPLAAVLTAAFLVMCLRLRAREESLPEAFLLGGVLGAAMLAKTTAVLAVPAGLALLGARRSRSWWGALAAGAFLTGGWWYVRGWLLHGAPFTGGWDPARGLAWSQDPGYRTAGDFRRFGAALGQPLYSGVAGFWDALYSTLWLDGWQSGIVNADVEPFWFPYWQAAAAWWGLVPTFFIILGARRAWIGNRKVGAAALPATDMSTTAGAAALIAIGCGLAALLVLFLLVPVYSTVKASYLLGLTPAAALLLADGLPEKGSKRIWAWALLSGWAACSVFAHLPR